MRTTIFSGGFQALGFREDTSRGAPLCRWLIDEMKLDVMPIEEGILGFTNRWYRAAMDTAQETELQTGLRIRVVTAPYFLATKLEAFRGRGKGGYAKQPRSGRSVDRDRWPRGDRSGTRGYTRAALLYCRIILRSP